MTPRIFSERRVLVIGGGGFIGVPLCRALLGLSWRVLCLDRGTRPSVSRLASLGRTDGFHRLNVPLSSLRGPVDAILDLSTRQDPELAAKDSAEAALALEVAERWGARLVHVGSDPSHRASAPLVQRHIETAERTVLVAASVGVDAQAIRVLGAHGDLMPSGRGRLAEMIRTLLKGQPVTVWGEGKKLVYSVHVSDIVTALISVLEMERAAPVAIEIGDSAGFPESNLAARLARLAGVELELRTKAGKRFYSRPANPVPALEHLCWSPMADIEAGLGEAVDWACTAWDLRHSLPEPRAAMSSARVEGGALRHMQG